MHTSLDLGYLNAAAAAGMTRETFDTLYVEHAGYIYNVCYRILGHADDARDVTQEAFIQLYDALPRYRGTGCLRAFLYRIAVNKCLDLLRKRRAAPMLDPLDLAALPESCAPDRTLEDRVRAALLQMKPAYRVVLVLFYFEEMSCDEIARCLRCTTVHVRVRLHRARKAFHALYGAMGDDDVL